MPDMKCSSIPYSQFVVVLLLYLVRETRTAAVSRRALSDTILHFEVLNFDRSHLLNEHSRVVRSTDRSSSVKWQFNAHGREFDLKLQSDNSIFTEDFVAESDQGRIAFDKRRAYRGHIQGDLGSVVTGVLLKDGRFEGTIKDKKEEFIIERAEKFLDNDTLQEEQFHSVIYKMSDVDMSALQNSTACKTDELKTRFSEIADNIYKVNHHQDQKRYRRSIDPTKTMCELYIQADHTYYNKYGSNEETVIEQLTAHVAAINTIYQSIDFDGDSSRDNIRFVIKRLKIWTSEAATGYPFPGNFGVEKFLETFSSSGNYDSYCLGYTFTYRDFNDGTLGLAWTGAVDTTGGVCAKNGIYQNKAMSLNTGIVTTLNFQRDVPFAVSKITFAHELGHNLGSGHDSESDSACAPGGTGGNYIMYPKATDGDKPNNNQFSSCSISAMNSVMNVHARDAEGCFKDAAVYDGTVCGNKIVESTEECDCGWEDECEETCCTPMKDNYDTNTYVPCKLVSPAACSPSQGQCCTSACTVKGLASNFECRTETVCQNSSLCDGSGASCPVSDSKTNGTSCASGMVCYLGDCSHSICEANGLENCQCSPDTAGDWADEKLCKLCCVDTSDNTCKPSSDIASIPTTSNGTIGQPCFDYQGYCDAFSKCREIDPVGAINRLKKMLFSEEGIATIKEWLTANWYIVVAAFVGFVIIMALVIRFGAKRHPEDEDDEKDKRKNKVYPAKQGGQPVNPRNQH